MIFKDRVEAGQKLAKELKDYQREEPMILALPRGGVPLGFEVAQNLSAPLDVVVARKLGAPPNPEFGIGAIAENNVILVNQKMVDRMGISQKQLSTIRKNEERELERRVEKYRGNNFPDVSNKLAIIVDDGLATGVTAQAAIAAVKKKEPKAIIFAAPVCAADSLSKIKGQVREIVCLAKPNNLQSIGMYYRHFEQTSDQQVLELIKQHKSAFNL